MIPLFIHSRQQMVVSTFLRKSLYALSFAVLLFLNGFLLHFLLHSGFGKRITNEKESCATATLGKFGFDERLFSFTEKKIKPGQLFPELLKDIGLSQEKVGSVMRNLDGAINMRNIRSGSTYTLVSTNECFHPDYLVYELDNARSVVCDLSGKQCPMLIEKQKELRRESAAGTITSSLWQALEDAGVSMVIIDQMEDALATSVDFLHVQEGSSFKLIFDRSWIEGKPSSEGKLLAAYFNTGSTEHHAFLYEVNGKADYYDVNGRPLRKSFLQAPVRFSRISSGFSRMRFHPVLKFSRPHFGTDYAAPVGTPIMAVGNGVVTAASYTSGNGNFVKIRHNQTYETQYLHMSRFASGIHPGTNVSQGQVIGYVGQTGLATGPHVCFRFWKNGVQVDHRKLRFPSGDPLPTSLLSNYFATRDSMMMKLNAIQGSAASVNIKRDVSRS